MLKQKFSIAPLPLLIILTSSCLVAGQVIRPLSCPKIKSVQNLNETAYLGSWYLYSRYLFIFEQDKRCQKFDYFLGPNQEYSVRNTEISNINNVENILTGNLTFFRNGQLQIQYDEPYAAPPFAYTILSTDYVNYVIIYACQNLLWSYAEYVWIRVRVPNPSQEVVDTFLADLKAQNISTNELVMTSQANCTNYSVN
ncbi:apolipoprotein D-like [Eurosta solidaginis]|uniref:apolipoprotein D-like n=1 Tax=Eurosta solidaginis TaxID=178769 RepID=UPI003530AC89